MTLRAQCPSGWKAARLEKRQEHCRHGTEDIHGIHKRLEIWPGAHVTKLHEAAVSEAWLYPRPHKTNMRSLYIDLSPASRVANELKLEHCSRLWTRRSCGSRLCTSGWCRCGTSKASQRTAMVCASPKPSTHVKSSLNNAVVNLLGKIYCPSMEDCLLGG